MKLTFDQEQIRSLIQYSMKAERWQTHYGLAGTDKPGLWLVGDDGVYFMDNAIPHLDDGQDGIRLAHAHEANSRNMPFDQWTLNKRASFGAEDGIEFLAAERIEAWLARNISRKTVSINLSRSAIELL